MLRSAALSIASAAKTSCKICYETSPARAQRCLSSTFSQTMQTEFSKDPEQAAAAVASLSDANKAEVLRALAGSSQGPVGSVKYLNSLFNAADLDNDGKLCKDELEAALKFHQLRTKNTRSGSPTREEVLRVFTASAIPFVGFGFLDNLIMIVAGDYIDAKLGAAFALSTMAAAGFGNLISDIAGIFMADSIESRARVFKYGRMPELSSVQRRSNSIFYVKSLGAVIGISIGCIAGMFPLVLTKSKESEAQTQDASVPESS